MIDLSFSAVDARRQSFANRVFFSNELFIEISVLIYTLKKCKIFIPGIFLSDIKADSKREVSVPSCLGGKICIH